MKVFTRTLLAAALTLVCSGAALATPSGQIWIPSPDAKGFGDVTVNLTNIARFSSAADSGPNYYDIGVTAGVLPFEKVKLEIGADYLTTGEGGQGDDHPFYFNAKLASVEDALFKGMPAIAVGVWNLGTYDKPEAGLSTRQNLAYGLLAKTLPVVGRISAGGYYGAKRALAYGTNGPDTGNNTGVLVSWDRTISEISDKLWLAVDYMSGNNGNGQIGFGGSWTFSPQVSLLAGVQIFNPGYKQTGGEGIPGGKPAFTTQLFINF
jgi:hypothetical protein